MISYEGKKDYIFISYSHRNEDVVMRIVNRLQNDGYRIWYDEGINPGNEWPEIVASHLKDCAVFIAFISEDYLDSFNCTREINYAVSRRKPFLAVYLQDVQMTPGMEMQLSGVPALSLHGIEEEEFFRQLYQTDIIASSREEAEIKIMEPVPDRPARKSRHTVLKITGIVVAVLLAVIIIRMAAGSITSINIAGTSIPRTETYLTLRSAVLSSEDLRQITKLDELHTLNITECRFTEGTEELKGLGRNITTLDMEGCTGISDYGFVSSLAGLQTLNITNGDITDDELAAIDFSSLPDLSNIRINGNKKITDIGPLAAVTKLRILEISDTSVSDLSALTDINTLTILRASDTMLTDLTPISLNTDLEELRVDSCKITSLRPLRDMTNLKILTAGRNELTDLDGLQDKEELVSLVLSENKLANLDGLESSFRLENLIAYGNALTSIEGLSSCTVLKNADLHDNELENVSVLSKSKETLVRLDLRSNRLEDLSALSGMPQLSQFYADDNMIDDLSFLKGSLSLEVISARNNRIRSFDPMAEMSMLKEIYLGNNKIEGAVKLENMPLISKAALEHNNINEISFSSEERASTLGIPVHLSFLSAYDNPLFEIKDVYKGVGEEKTDKKINEGWISFPAEEEAKAAGYVFDPYALTACFHELYLTDCPYDARLELEESNSMINYTDTANLDRMMQDKNGGTGFSLDL